jgi:hypothetical protein
MVPASRRAQSRAAAAFVARNGSLDHFVRLRQTAPHPAKSATLELVVEARDPEHAQEIRDRLAAKGFRQA